MPVIISPYVPEYITVHLGPPNSNAQNVTILFSDYIKNVASSEIYPTWEDSALYANIYAQISFALNRVYLEYYMSQGYNFNITSSTAIDQNFQLGRNIFENISYIVDEIFNDYIRRIGVTEPLAARYCNGTTVTCEGMSQWGSQNLARQGYTSIQILRYYYGNNIELVTDAPIMGIRNSYPGTPIRRGSQGPSVIVIQTSLNRISQNYPLIPKISPVDGIFGPNTENAVRTFQGIFNLTRDGIVGKATWYRIVNLYTGILRLSELESEGQRLFGISFEYPDAISEGNTGEKVLLLQYMLSVINEFQLNIPFVAITGEFGPETKNAVTEFQKVNNLPETGVVGDDTWDAIYNVYSGIVNNTFTFRNISPVQTVPFPGYTLKLGSRGEYVIYLQQYLNEISLVYNDFIDPPPINGAYDQKTLLAVTQFQALFSLPKTGEVNRLTWNTISNIYKDVLADRVPTPRQYPGYELKIGAQDQNTVRW